MIRICTRVSCFGAGPVSGNQNQKILQKVQENTSILKHSTTANSQMDWAHFET